MHSHQVTFGGCTNYHLLHRPLPQVTESNDIIPSGGFDTPARSLAINNDSIYRVAENRLEVCNAAGEEHATHHLLHFPCLAGCVLSGLGMVLVVMFMCTVWALLTVSCVPHLCRHCEADAGL